MIQRILFVVASVVAIATAADPVIVSKGAGESEFSILFAQNHLADLLGSCIQACRLSTSELGSLKLLKSLAGHPPTANFGNSAQLGNRLYHFAANHQIWFNQDLLWTDKDRSVPYDVADAVTLWVDVLADEASATPPGLSLIRAKIHDMLTEDLLRTATDAVDGVTFEALIWQSANENARLFIRDAALITQGLSDLAVASIACSANPTSLKMFSPQWRPFGAAPRGGLIGRLDVNATWLCQQVPHRGQMTVIFDAFQNAGKGYQIEPATVEVYTSENN